MKTFIVSVNGVQLEIVQNVDGEFIIPNHLNGLGTSLKPAAEFWWLIRKPLEPKLTVAANVLKHGTGGINIDASRIGTEERTVPPTGTRIDQCEGRNPEKFAAWQAKQEPKQVTGRFPANLVLSHNHDCVEMGTKKVKGDSAKPRNRVTASMTFADEKGMNPNAHQAPNGYADTDGTETVAAWQCEEGCAVKALDEQSGSLKARGKSSERSNRSPFASGDAELTESNYANDSGGASRFFYIAKASKADKGVGNNHPTPKSTALMTYLIRLVTPPGGVVLDPFMGSGSTGVAAIKDGFKFVGIEKELEYYEIAKSRLEGIK